MSKKINLVTSSGSFLTLLLLLLSISFLAACSAPKAAPETYKITNRQHAPEPVYSRVTWSHLPKPIMPKATNEAPFVLPIVEFDMPQATLREAVEALAQAMGYRWHYPASVASRRIKIRMEGTVEEILKEIGNQAKVYGSFDHQQRLVTIVDDKMLPKLPRGK